LTEPVWSYRLPVSNGISHMTNFPHAEPEAVGMSSARLGRIVSLLNATVEAGQLPGAVIGPVTPARDNIDVLRSFVVSQK
jgi:hypothetical protein